MNLDRIDLADITGPVRLAREIHARLKLTSGPVPVEQISRALDIVELKVGMFDGFEGMLLTDEARREGVILANNRHGDQRARYTIGHELGHFLLERHRLSDDNGFRCRASDLRETGNSTPHDRQEMEANQFSGELLCPRHLAEPCFQEEPSLRDAITLKRALDISLEAAVRRMVALRDEPLAAVFSVEGRIRYLVRGTAFPFVTVGRASWLPKDSEAATLVRASLPGTTAAVPARPLAWTDRPDIEVLEQTRLAGNGHAVTLLWAKVEPRPATDEDEDLLPKLRPPMFR